uniref:hypothetical protein n=1 Tax=Polyozellus multiplex TaxID=281719 RepID=UPI001F145997|nr:hypothetical protein MN596_mgp06 [Polyozellus multiplex]UMI33317.1 hypothetical protein [Polyozellus multiplex]
MIKLLLYIIKFLRKISKMSIITIFTQIINIIQGKSILKSLYKLFRYISIIFTIIFLINDNLALNYMDYFQNLFSHPSLILEKLKFIWNKIIDFILNILGKTKLDEIPEPKMLTSNETKDPIILLDLEKDKLQFMNKNSLDEYTNQHNKSGKDVRIIIEDAYGNKYNDNWSFYWKLAFIIGLIISGTLIVTMISNGITEMIKFPFNWAYDHLLQPIYVFFGIIFYFIKYFLSGGGDPGEFSNLIRDRFGVEIFHTRHDSNNIDLQPKDNPDIQEIRLDDSRPSKGKGKEVRFDDNALENIKTFNKYESTSSISNIKILTPEDQVNLRNELMPNKYLSTEDNTYLGGSPILTNINLDDKFSASNIISSSLNEASSSSSTINE